MSVPPDYNAISAKKQLKRDSLIPQEWKMKDVSEAQNVINVPMTCGLLSARELEITGDNDAVALLEHIKVGEYTSEEANCLTEIFFDEAIARAKELDAERANATGSCLRPLHGLTISLKDSLRIPGVDSTIGLICFADKPHDVYSVLPKLLLDLGAVLYCKTNVPRTMMTADSDNNVFGMTLNPWHKKLTAGGSSGGEGALIAMRGSVLGIGTDIAGSTRIPSVCNGIYGIRPSASVVPFAGQQSPAMAGLPGILPVAGPMATSFRSCTYFMKTIMESEAWKYDSGCLHLPWQGLLPKSSLRIGLVSDDGLHTPWPPVRRALSEAAAKLKAAGVEVIPIELPAVVEAIGATLKMFSLDGSKFIQDLIALGNEPLVTSVQKVNLAGVPTSDIQQLCELIVTRSKIQKIYQDLWVENKLDAILVPGAPTTATPHDEWASVAYTALWKFLDYPAVIMPTGKVQEADVVDDIGNAQYGEAHRKYYGLCKVYGDTWMGALLIYVDTDNGPANYADVTLTVQVVGMKQEDEKLALVAEFVDHVVNA